MKNISIYKFLLPVSVVMLAMGAIIFFLGYLPGSNLSSAVGMICGGLLFFGFIFFIVSLIDSSISRKRAIADGQEEFSVQRSHTTLKYIGIAIIAIVVFSSLIILYLLSTMWG